MASFRARRTADPKPIHYGSFTSKSRHTSSLNDLDAAWENVDEARSALQAVEARIQEANHGFRHKRLEEQSHDESAIREVFSQNQRLGRVSRYELRPVINEHHLSREMDQSLRHSMSEFPSDRKKTTEQTSYSRYNGSKYSERVHSPPSRDKTLSPRKSDNNSSNDSIDLSLRRSLDSNRTRDIIKPSGILNNSGFEDSLDVPSLKRKKLNGLRPLSPIISIPDNSDALARLKERIKKQKEKTPVPKQKENEDAANVIQVSFDERQKIDNEESTVRPVCKRKVVTAAPPTGYKGFSMPEATSSKDKDNRTTSRSSTCATATKAGQKRAPQQQNQNTGGKTSKGGIKMRRITAPKAPIDFITPYSWRTGMETVKKVLGPSNTRPKSSKSTRPQSAASQSASQDITISTSRNEIKEKWDGKWDGKPDEREEEKNASVAEEKAASQENGLLDDTELSEGLLSEGILSEDAKNILSDLEIDSDASDDEDNLVKECRGTQQRGTKTAAKEKPLTNDLKGKKSKMIPKKRIPSKQKSPETIPPKSIIQRHYDVDKVKKYMEKKIKDRKQKLREEKQMKQEALDGRKKRLETLYNKQKKILATNLNQNSSKNKMGETHVIPGNYPFQRQQIGFLPEILSQETESERESTDVDSFTALPTSPPRGPTRPGDNGLDSSSFSDISQYTLSEETKDREDDEQEDNMADVTLNPSGNSHSRSGIWNGEVEEREEQEEDNKHAPYTAFSMDRNQVPTCSRTDRIEALKNTAAELKHRLEQEARRLGLSMIEKEQPVMPLKGVTLKEPDVFRGNLPGVSNLHEQAELNDQLDSMNSAATRIQAVYRGYSTRQGLNWRLPSGQTLGGIIRNAPRRSPVEGRADSIPLYLASDTSSDGHLSDVETAYSHVSDRSFHSRNRKPERSLESRSSAASTQAKGPASGSLSTGHYRPSTTLGKTLADKKGDRMSVINIYLRNLSSLREGQEEKSIDKKEHDTRSLYSDDFNFDHSSETTSLINDVEELRDESIDLDRTLIKESPTKDSIGYDEQPPDNRSPSVDGSINHSLSSHGSLSLSQTDTEYSPIRPSTRTASTPSVSEDNTHPGQSTNHYQPPLYFPTNHTGGTRMSPGSLHQRMTAELNRLEFMEESVRQLTDIERTNAVSLAQQETVSLAQVLKAKQASYAKDIEALQLKAQKEKLDAARELEEARYSAKKSSLDAQEAVAKVKAEASNNIVQSTDRLVKAQTEAARMTADSAKKVEEARNEAAKTLLEAAHHQVNDVRTAAVSAASAAAQEAVRSTLEQFRHEGRPSRKYDSPYTTPESRSRSSYSRSSYTEERSPSYSRSRTSRTATERESSASKDGHGYTSDEFESFKESEITKSIRTATPDQTHISNQADGSFILDRERSGTKSSESIAEEVDASISEECSVASDSITVDKSIEEAVEKDKDQTDRDYTMTFEESMVSSRNATDDEMDYRLILPSEGHRRRSIEKIQRSASICSDAGTYSSDEGLDKHLSESLHERTAPFSGEDSFSKFTTDMVKLMREEEVRAKHLEALLHLREKALKENTKAEMEWLELQKKQMRDKGADDAMPFIKKRQRDVIKRLKTEKAEIKYLMAAHRAARYDRKLMMMSQEEITRLRRSTHKIRGKVREEEGSRDKPKSEVSEESTAHTRRSTPVSADREEDESPSKSTTVPEEISAIESPTADTSFPTYENDSTISERVRKRSLSEGESDDGATSGVPKSKSSPSTSDSIVMQRLKKLKSQSSERYLTQREQKLMRRKQEGDDLSDRKLIEWERRLEEEEDKLNDANRIKSKRAIKATQNRSKEDDLVNMAPDRSREGSLPELDYVSKDFSEASDHSDVESRIRELRDQLQQREQEVRRLHKEQKRQKRAMLHEEEETLRKKLQAVEKILQKTKENLERPTTENRPSVLTTSSPVIVKPTLSNATISERDHTSASINQEVIARRENETEQSHHSARNNALEKSGLQSNTDSISERIASRSNTMEDRSASDNRNSDKSSFSDSFRGLNVVLDIDLSSQGRETGKELKSVSEVKDLDISDRSGVFENDYTPFSQSEEIEDNAPTAEDISQTSEIRTVSEGSVAGKLSRTHSARSSLAEVIPKDDSQNSVADGLSEKQSPRDDSIPEAISERSYRSSGEDSISEAISRKSSRRSGSESISEVISGKSHSRSGAESISEAISGKSSKRSGTESISEAISGKSSQRSGSESLSEAISIKSSQRSGIRSISEALSIRSEGKSGSESVHEVLAGKSKSEVPSGRSPVNEYSNTFESDQDKDETDDDISEQIIEDEGVVEFKETAEKSYTSDFEPSERRDQSFHNSGIYSQDFEAPSSSHMVEQPSLEKQLENNQLLDVGGQGEVTQHRLSQATDEESIAEEIPEGDKSGTLGIYEDGPKEENKGVEHDSNREDLEEGNLSHYSEDFEISSHKVSESLSKQRESDKPRLTDNATDEESIAEDIPEDQHQLESGALSDGSVEQSPSFSLKEQGLETFITDNQSEENSQVKQNDESQHSQDFESPSSQRTSKQFPSDEPQKPTSIAKEPSVESDVISPQRRLSGLSDDGSIAEELPEELQGSIEDGRPSSVEDNAPSFVDAADKTFDVDIASSLEPEKRQVIKENDDIENIKTLSDLNELRINKAEEIVHSLSSTLVDDAVTCMSNLYDVHKHKSAGKEPNKKTSDSTVDKKEDSDKEDSINEWGKAPEEGFEVSEGEDLSISERLSFTDDEGSLPLFNLKPQVTSAQKEQQISTPPLEEQTPDTKTDEKAASEHVLKELSENLLKEAASKMIALLRQKQAKMLEQTHKFDQKEHPPKSSIVEKKDLQKEQFPNFEKKELPKQQLSKFDRKDLPKSPPPHSPELSPRGFDKFMAVMKPASPPGSPTKDGSSIDGHELADRLSQLKLLHDEIGAHLGDEDDEDDFVINANKPLELPTDKEEYGPPSGQSIPIVVPHSNDDVVPLVSKSLATFYGRKMSGGSIGNVTPPAEFSENNIDENDPDSKIKQSYRQMIFDLTGEVFRDVLSEECPPERPSWMKPRRRRKNRFYHSLSPVSVEHDYRPIVQQRVLDLVGLGNERPNLDTLRRKTPLKLGKKDFVDAVLIQELREEEPQWVDYDDDELAVKFQVADSIFESLLSETVMVLNAVQRRKESILDVTR